MVIALSAVSWAISARCSALRSTPAADGAASPVATIAIRPQSPTEIWIHRDRRVSGVVHHAGRYGGDLHPRNTHLPHSVIALISPGSWLQRQTRSRMEAQGATPRMQCSKMRHHEQYPRRTPDVLVGASRGDGGPADGRR